MAAGFWRPVRWSANLMQSFCTPSRLGTSAVLCAVLGTRRTSIDQMQCGHEPKAATRYQSRRSDKCGERSAVQETREATKRSARPTSWDDSLVNMGCLFTKTWRGLLRGQLPGRCPQLLPSSMRLRRLEDRRDERRARLKRRTSPPRSTSCAAAFFAIPAATPWLSSLPPAVSPA